MSWVHRRRTAGQQQSGKLPERPPGRRAARGRTTLVGGLAALLTGTMLTVTAAPAQAVYTESDFEVDKHDLEFILKQIKISESHAAGGKLLCDDRNDTSWTCVPDPKLPYGLRTVDGSYNNLMSEDRKNYGAALQTFPRLLEPSFRDAEPVQHALGGQAVGSATSYKQKTGYVWDSQPRLVSNLIVDQTTDNPAAVAALEELGELGAETYDHDNDPATPDAVFLPNVSPDEGLSAPFNSWFTLFGQFFDHGLDMVSKGGNGTVIIPLTADDPLYEPGGRTNFLMLTRATNLPGPDGQLGTEDDIPEHTNRTTPFVDQNQTYTSHPSHQVFLREYEMVDGVPVPTGRLLDSVTNGSHGPATWADVKAQARDLLGIELDDMDVHNVPLVATDPYGRFLPGANGFPQLVIPGDPNTLAEGDPGTPVDASPALKAGHAFLDDIGHNAVPTTHDHDGDAGTPAVLNPDADDEYNPVDQPLAVRGTYDDELLDAHFITGDGRGNENIGLTAVHHVFHSEHNRLAAHIEDVIDSSGDQEFVDAWHDTSGPWDYGERIFQAARYVTEMQYQHLVFEEFARKIQPSIDAGPLNESLYHADVNPAVTAEFAHVVYRFGHSMLTDTVARDGYESAGVDDISLLDAFLNPAEFAPGDLTPQQGAAAIVQGMMNQTGNGIDEFVVDTLRNNLLGLPLDLATINMARARDAGVPSLQTARRTFYNATGDPAVKPYANWLDFRLALRHRSSLVNFIAAYGTHESITAVQPGDADFIAGRRAAAQAIVATIGTSEQHPLLTQPAAQSGLDDVDFWAGGLAERPMVFGGMLGTTFNVVFEEHLEDLQNGDRFYYLNRNQGLNLFHQLEANSFAELVMRNTDAKNVPTDLFASQDLTIDLADPATYADRPQLIQVDGAWRWDGAEHITIHGTDSADSIHGGDGDDSLWGHGGDDRMEGGVGNDEFHGGPGDDVLTDLFGDDVIHGGPGNDAINGGPGADILFGQSGRDFVLHGQEVTRSFAGAGDDFVLGGNANDIIGGDQGSDWLEGGGGHDLVQGDLALTFQNDPYGGADVLNGGSGNDDHDAEGGDDVMLNNGRDRHAGMLGFDWVTHKLDPDPVETDLDVTVFQPPNVTVMRSRYMNVEGLSGWSGDDILRGRSNQGDQAFEDGTGHELTDAHLDLVVGLRDLLGGADAPFAAPFRTTEQANNIILGGGGADLIQPRDGSNFIDGDAALDVYIEGPGGERADGMAAFRDRVFRGDINPAELTIRREVVDQGDDAIDTVSYPDAIDPEDIVALAEGLVQVTHATGTDVLRNVERVQAAGVVINLVDLPVVDPVVTSVEFSTTQPTEDQELTATVAVAAGNTVESVAWQHGNDTDGWETSNTVSGEEFTTDADGTTVAAFTPGDAEAGRRLRIEVTFNDGTGSQSFTSTATEPVLNVNDAPTAPVLSTATPTAGGTISVASAPTDADGPNDENGELTVPVSYQWQQGAGGAFSDIPGATGSQLAVTEAQELHRLRVVATYTDAHGTEEQVTSEATAEVPEVTPPAAPTISSVTAGPSSATVTWSAPADTGGAQLLGFTILVSTGGTVVDTIEGISAEQTSETVTGLTAGTDYSFRVIASNAFGTSAASAPVSATPTGDTSTGGGTIGGGGGGAGGGTGGGGDGGTGDGNDGGDGGTGDGGTGGGTGDGGTGQTLAVTSSVPAAGATTASRTDGVTMTLTGEATNVDASTVRLLRPNGTVVPTTVEYDPQTGEIRLSPRGILAPGRRFTVLVTGLTDADGNTMPTMRWSFRTVDDQRPSVVRVRPADQAQAVRPAAVVRVRFSEKVTGLDQRTVRMRQVGGPRVAVTLRYRPKMRMLVIRPDARLARATRYVVRLRPGVRDLADNRLARTVWRFTTR